MTRTRMKPSKYSPTKAMKVHQLHVAGLSWKKIHEQMGIAVSTACAWDRIVMSNPKLLKEAETEKHPEDTKEMGSTIKDMTLKGENEYLRWWNQGERKGWVDRLLSEIQ